jgi:hypothetical protein
MSARGLPGSRRPPRKKQLPPPMAEQWRPEPPSPAQSEEQLLRSLLAESVRAQSELMLDKLVLRSKKYRNLGGDLHWLVVPDYMDRLRRHLKHEVRELEIELEKLMECTIRMEIPSDALLDRIADESADVCNLAMMIKERARLARNSMAAASTG